MCTCTSGVSVCISVCTCDCVSSRFYFYNAGKSVPKRVVVATVTARTLSFRIILVLVVRNKQNNIHYTAKN